MADLNAAFLELTTPAIADAAVRLGVPFRVAPPGIRPVAPNHRVVGRARPVRHYGSGDLFFEAMNAAEPGDVLIIDNGGRTDEACIGDLIVLEAQAARLAGIVAWGLHRDTAELIRIGLPVFSCGMTPVGPRRLDAAEPDALRSARVGEHLVTADDVVFGDLDGVVFLPHSRVDELLAVATEITKTERRQAADVRSGRTLREQFRFAEYLARRRSEPSYTFRMHLRAIGGAIEE
jgi:regulator of RNase E activity RraA